jgi:cell division protein FtsW (lipid II flippase)
MTENTPKQKRRHNVGLIVGLFIKLGFVVLGALATISQQYDAAQAYLLFLIALLMIDTQTDRDRGNKA